MLTGDKVETARCIAISIKLVARNQYIHEISKSMSRVSISNLTVLLPSFSVQTADQLRDQLEFLQNKLDCCLVIDGDSLQVRTSLL